MNLKKLSEVNDPYFSEVFKLLSKSVKTTNIGGDSAPYYNVTTSVISELADLQHDYINKNLILQHGSFETPSEAFNNMLAKMTGDSLYNRETGVGTMLDPTLYTHSTIPVSIGPHEGTALYTSGGLPQIIIDKKARSMLLSGVAFNTSDSKFWDNTRLDQLKQEADHTRFNEYLRDSICDSYVYGGSILYPVFKGESATSYLRDVTKLHLEKGCIDRWVTVDRWNVTYVPNFIVTAEDYLHPKSIYVPMGSVELSTSRVALIKPKNVSYWASLYNLGWGPSDFSGWLRAYYGYKITVQSLPVMAQQMSLLLYRMPLDGLNATIGPDRVKELMQINEEQMKQWSSLSPKAVNMVGEVEVVDRTYTGIEQLVGAMKSDLAAQSGIPEPILWHTPNKGFSDNTTESLLKQSETMALGCRQIEDCIRPLLYVLVAHTFGDDSEEIKHLDSLRFKLDAGTISTEKEMGETGARFAASVNSFVQAGVSPDIAVELSKPFFPSVRISDDMVSSIKASYKENQKAIKGSNNGAKIQSVNTGWGTK